MLSVIDEINYIRQELFSKLFCTRIKSYIPIVVYPFNITTFVCEYKTVYK